MNPPFVNLDDIIPKREALRKQGVRVVVTNGCFDLLHVGHLRYLTQARACGDFLWVGLNSDASVRELKGSSRPIYSQEDRAEILGGLKVVDAVSIFEGMRATEFLKKVQPDVYVKGGDYTLESLDPGERQALEACGAEIRLVGLVPGKSTTLTLQKIQK